MEVGKLKTLLNCTSGAVAPTVALSLVALIAAGGIGFDYARLAGMHSELQNAADQAALAAASQLDGKVDATRRAAEAAANLVLNSTIISDDSKGASVGIANVAFFEDKARTKPVTRDDSTSTDDALARYVEVTVDGRKVFYALTPVVAVFNSGDIDADAMAGLGSATCKVPPVMMCNPGENSGDPNFTAANYIGKGIKLVSVGNGSGGWVPGDFGYLDTGDTTNGANGLRKALGWTEVPGDCSPDTGVDTKPGATVSVTGALNTRFDIYDANSCVSGGACPPSANSTKDLVKTDGTNGNACTNGPQGWKISNSPYLPASATPLTVGTGYPDAMGYPRDMCHAVSSDGTCTDGRIGNGNWDIDAYFYVNYAHASHATWAAAVAGGTNPITVSGISPPYGVTRYQVYRWEMANAGTTINGEGVLAPHYASGNGGNTLRQRGAPYCSAPGVTPGGTSPDRRRISIAVINCQANGVKGNSTDVPVEKWVDVFLVEPSVNRARTSQGDVYVEVIGESGVSGDGTAGQVVRRDVPYLVR